MNTWVFSVHRLPTQYVGINFSDLYRDARSCVACTCGVLRSSLAVPSFMQICVNIESFAALGSGLCQHCSYLRSHSRQRLMPPIEIPENRAG